MDRAKKVVGAVVPLAAYVAGLGLIAYGAWEVYEPAGLIVGGLLLSGSAWRYAAAETEIEL